MRHLLCTLLVACIYLSVSAQDILYKTDNSKIECKVVEIRPNSIKYSLTGGGEPLIEVDKSELLLVEYGNGDYEVFVKKEPAPQANPIKPPPYQSPVNPQLNLKRNIISFGFLDVLLWRIQMTYEHISRDGKVGYKVPISLGLFQDEPSFFTGFDLNLYPDGQRRVSYFLGPKIRGGYIHDEIFRRQTFFALFLNNGVVMSNGKSVTISVSVALGAAHSITDDYTIPMATMAFQLGFRL